MFGARICKEHVYGMQRLQPERSGEEHKSWDAAFFSLLAVGKSMDV